MSETHPPLILGQGEPIPQLRERLQAYLHVEEAEFKKVLFVG